MRNRHTRQHEHAGRTVLVKTQMPLYGQRNPPHLSIPLLVEDWWDRIEGRSWMDSNDNPACLFYAVRSGCAQLPLNDEVLYGETGDGTRHLVHESEIHGIAQ